MSGAGNLEFAVNKAVGVMFFGEVTEIEIISDLGNDFKNIAEKADEDGHFKFLNSG